ncbi:MAG: ABC transporter ATP-binding protein [Bryobacterales bacterium]|jgi:ABC-type polysaccharide/polyol phosphate transport system ATPase subunit|nr:ABC transporter ATP-binding protein [Bryobacterales bacterium]
MAVIEFQGVSKSFQRHAQRQLLRSRIRAMLTGQLKDRFQALRNVSFRVEKGESVAIVGHNGAGKSTLLSLIAGLAIPDEGAVHINGRVSALLELGSGFHGDLTGRENVHLNASLIGWDRKRTTELFDAVVEFSGLGEFIEEPLRTYSSGMVMRLAFAVAVHIDPEVLLLDEVLVVGDQSFQVKCIDRIREFRRQGRSLIAVSHAPALVRSLCDRALWLDHGELVMDGDVNSVIDAYQGNIVR